jgi:hypothetical protein
MEIKTFGLPYLPQIIEDYNNTPSFAFRDIEELKNEPKTMKGKPYYRPVAPNVMANSGPKILNKIHEHEGKQAATVREIDNEKFKVGDYVRLLEAHTKKSIKENGKFLKKSIANSWTTRIYQIIERTGPNFWRVNDAGDGEIKQWTTAMMKKATKKAYDEQTTTVKRDEANKKAVRVSRAKAKEQQNVSKEEQKTKATRTRGEGMTTRGRAKKKVDYAQLAGGRK